MGDVIVGILVVVLGGTLSGLFTAPMSYNKGWAWENGWLIYSIYAMLLCPWIFAFYALDDLPQVYQESPAEAIGAAIGLGCLWGIGSVLFGLGVDAVGHALAFAIILGLTSAIGAALPLVILHPDDIGSRTGIFTWVALGVVIIGLVVLAKAGARREREQKAGETKPLLLNDEIAVLDSISHQPGHASFARGLIICLISGLASPCLNLGITFGDDVSKKAKDLGNSATFADNATWCLMWAEEPFPTCSTVSIYSPKSVYQPLSTSSAPGIASNASL
ncbi:uncharacterized protein MONBRDRAFT_30717 [Monosiga brevicollis MX1]|uniref:Uncharacterized protein n=1 Tax=Monosiga brevicollis TaxID=81824 RepID=A9UNS0_MONBE|nr:uncharacterized protein MONBRDRAFT_30717 [Monosiga brevicollis MX1]EDQ92293.1 predicted protein [Monosiga brevicollis MX1]|eukprot:XP_001742055.1 hypothetical protein [Monosiga brevicollis MX1]